MHLIEQIGRYCLYHYRNSGWAIAKLTDHGTIEKFIANGKLQEIIPTWKKLIDARN